MTTPATPISPIAMRGSQGSSYLQREVEAFTKGRNLVLCFDGTDNEFGDTNTSIVKLFTFLEKESPEQLCYYQTGVGTYVSAGYANPVSKWVAKAVDLGVAAFLDQHVQGGYQFLQSTYTPGDRIYLFGFSRGAYTARALAGMLYTVGLLPKSMPEQVPFAYDIFMKGKESTAYKRAFSRSVTIEFLGVFDTVASVGAIIPRVLPFSSDNHITKTFRHAMALDEHRAKFRSNPWHQTVDPVTEDEFDGPQTGIFRTAVEAVRHHHQMQQHAHQHSKTLDEQIAQNEDRIALDHEEGLDARPATNVKEVWFSGCHCDIGGGNAKDSDPHALANVPLKWMLKEIIASDTGLIFRRSALARAHIDLDELVEAAARTKIEDARLAAKNTPSNPSSPIDANSLNKPPILDVEVDLDVNVNVSNTDGGPIASANANDVKQKKVLEDQAENAAETEALYKRWKTSSGVADAECGITDELTRSAAWWLLEFLPFIDSQQDPHGHWKNRLYVNLFGPRDIPRPPDHSNPNSSHNKSTLGVAITDAPALFHISVKHRMLAPACEESSWRTFWKKVPYRPRAWPKTGEPVWVE